MPEKDITIIQDSQIALQVINKALKSDKGLVFVYVDQRQGTIDGRSVTCDDIKKLSEPSGEDDYIFPNIVPSETVKIPDFIRDEFERCVKRFPQPVLANVIRTMFEIAYEMGHIDEQRGQFLGIGKSKFNYWSRKLKIGGTE